MSNKQLKKELKQPSTKIFGEPREALKILGTGGRMNAFKDDDKDGVVNISDCSPKDPTKQGLAHRLAKRAARRVLKGGLRYRTERYIERKERESEVLREARRKARQEEKLAMIEIRKEKRIKAYRERKPFRETLIKAIPRVPIPKPRYAIKKVKGKKVRVAIQPSAPKPVMFDLSKIPKIPI